MQNVKCSKMVPAALNQSLTLFGEARAQLIQLGFSLNDWMGYPYLVNEFPKPAFMYDGELGDIDLGYVTASYPFDIDWPVMAMYERALANILRQRTKPMGRPMIRFWSDIVSTYCTTALAIFTPMRSGYYGLPRPQHATGYHVAEFAWMIHRAFEDESTLEVGKDSFYVLYDDLPIGVIEGKVIRPDGSMLPLDHPFEPNKLFQLRDAPLHTIRKSLGMWRAIGAFVERNGIRDTHPDLMQALCHCRHGLPETLMWTDSAHVAEPDRQPRRTISAVTPVANKALALEGAISVLKLTPHVRIWDITRRVVPTVFTHAEWKEHRKSFSRKRPLHRQEMLMWLEQTHRELLDQI